MLIPDIKLILEGLYNDKMTVFRYTEIETDYGTTENKISPFPELTDIKCRLSFKSKDDALPSEDGNPIIINPILFCAPDVEIRSGDYVEITRHNRVYKGRLGDPVIYENSLQTQMTIKESS